MNLDLAERVWVRFLDTHSPGPGDRAHCVRDLAAALQPELDALAARVAEMERALVEIDASVDMARAGAAPPAGFGHDRMGYIQQTARAALGGKGGAA